MTELLRAVILGIIQGLTEFLPVSSSGHLELAKFFLGDQSLPAQSLMMTVVLHFGTALATLVVFRKEVLEILRGLLRVRWNEEKRFTVYIIVSMVPAALAGFFLEDEIDALFNKQIILVGISLMLTGILLFFADRAKNTNRNVSGGSAFLIGLSQAVAIIPGISRSGATISTSVLLGIDREKAARFSFLMVVPLIFGKITKDMMGGEFGQSAVQAMPLIAGFFAAFISGVFACSWMIALVKNSKLTYFSIYCFIIGIAAIILYLA
ncbi:MAG: undecaprenyl-diphosphate phosphatase [Saprospiraceae bacterium]